MHHRRQVSQRATFCWSLLLSERSMGRQALLICPLITTIASMETKNKHHQNLIITDASGIISMVVETDTNHAAAKAYAEQHRTTGAVFFVPGELFAETVNLIG